MTPWTRRTFVLSLLALAGCRSGSGREFTLLGYSARPPYRDDVRTVFVPIFKNEAFQTTPNREMELEITKAIVTEIEARTPMKVVSDPERADTELLGTIRSITQNNVNINQQILSRESEITVTCDIVWKDLRTGQILSNRRPANNGTPVVQPFDPTITPIQPDAVKERITAVRVVGMGRVIAELGQSNATANQEVAKSLAKQIVQMMEEPW